MRKAIIVIGANFGDEGKGFVVSELVRDLSNNIVIRSNGGAQAGHTVFHNWNKVTFHHFGSGTHLYAPTYLSEDFIVNPIMFNIERHDLKIKNINRNPNVIVNENCLVTFVTDMILNQLKENKRKLNSSDHGTCGVGIYETIKRSETLDYRVKDLNGFYDDDIIKNIKDYFYDQIEKDDLKDFFIGPFKNILESPKFKNDFNSHIMDFLEHVSIVNDESFLNSYENLIFEGAQGLLLDQNNKEYFPFLTPSNTGSKNPIKVLKNIGFDENIHVYYVTRPYMTRHGNGPFHTECKDFKEKYLYDDESLLEINKDDGPQGVFRYGYLDIDLLKHSIEKDFKNFDDISVNTIRKTLNVTCRNHIKDNKIPISKTENISPQELKNNKFTCEVNFL